MERIKIGVLISGGGSNLQAIIDACEKGRINGKVVFVGSDRPDVYGLERAKKHKIPTFVVNYLEYLKRPDEYFKGRVPTDCDCSDILAKVGVDSIDVYWTTKMGIKAFIEAELLKEMAKYQFDLLVLAGFMRLLTPYFIDKVNADPERPRIMNIHPALLPSFPGTDGYGDTWRYGCKFGGSTVHFVDYGEDTGPIIGQAVVPVRGDSLEDFKTRGLVAEHELYPRCIHWYAKGRLKVVERTMPGKKPKKVVELSPYPEEMQKYLGPTETHNHPCQIKRGK